MSWNWLLQLLSFTGVKDVSVWQDVLFGVLLIPVAIKVVDAFVGWWGNKRPLRLLLKGCLSSDAEALIFLSQLSALDDNGQIDDDPKYVIRYPTPKPTDKSALGLVCRQNIDPVWSEAEGECLADIHNVLGRAGKVRNVRVGNLINDWNEWSKPTFSIGFTPRTHKLIEKCDPIHFEIGEADSGYRELGIEGCDARLDSRFSNDAGVLQKTFLKNSNTPVFILAGLGTTGTGAAGYFLRENCVTIGKLYGDKPFCFLLRVKMDEGRTSVAMQDACPKPSATRVVLHPAAYFRFFRKATSD